jgi:16S rRNA (adenine1518-N6/adenine1519-N6)-dimethyltransferase
MNDVIPRKSLGQHWLSDVEALRSVIEGVAVSHTDTVLEVGPGLGTLTRELLTEAAHVVAVEFDPLLAKTLETRLSEDGPLNSELTVVNEDILAFDFASMPHPYKVVANIPYYLTSNLIRTLSETSNPPEAASLLIQKEVAERVCAKPGQMSILSVTAQYYWECSLGRVVKAELFTPPPKVDSQVLILKYRQEPLFEEVDTKQFFQLVKAGFSQKRKTLHNSLSGGLAISKEQAKELLDAADVPATARAQTLSLDDWYALYEVFAQN